MTRQDDIETLTRALKKGLQGEGVDHEDREAKNVLAAFDRFIKQREFGDIGFELLIELGHYLFAGVDTSYFIWIERLRGMGIEPNIDGL